MEECGRAMDVSVMTFCNVNTITFMIEEITNSRSTIGNSYTYNRPARNE